MFDSLELSLPIPPDAERAEVECAKNREPAAWAAWYDRYFPALYRYALARTANREEAEDIASQVFVRALESIDRYRYEGRPVLAWLYRICHNLVADRARRDKRRPYIPLESIDAKGTADEQLIARTELAEALNRLNREQREVVVLRYLVAMNTREIAAAMGKSEAAVYSLQVRAVSNLRKALKL